MKAVKRNWLYCENSVSGTRLTPLDFKKSFRLKKDAESYVTVNFSTPRDKNAPCMVIFSQAYVKEIPASQNKILPGLSAMLGNQLVPIHHVMDIEDYTAQEILLDKDAWLPKVKEDLLEFNGKRQGKILISQLEKALNGNQSPVDPDVKDALFLCRKTYALQG